jgi:hypothetical protein
MSEFKLRSEIDSANEFIQFLELLESGSLATNTGINRALQRLAENTDALLEALQSSRFTNRLADGGVVSLSAGTLNWTADITVMVNSEIGGAVINLVSGPSNLPGIVDTDVIYVILDRTTDSAVLSLNKADIFTFLGTVAGAANRLDILPIAFKTSNGLHFSNGQRLRDGQSLKNNFFTDTQYGQQVEGTLVRLHQQENNRIMLTRGGDLSWDASPSALFTWSEDLFIEFPGQGRTNKIAAGSINIPPGEAMYVTLVRSGVGDVPVVPSVGPIGSLPTADGSPISETGTAADNTFVIAIHKTLDSRLYLWNGDGFSDGETRKLGGAQTGVNWMYRNVGGAVQVTDFTLGGFPQRAFTVVSGELMVYRNGIKARRSDAVWNGASFPYDPLTPGGGGGNLLIAGSLNGTPLGPVLPEDDYIEEVGPDGVAGTRIIWLADGKAGNEALFHPPAGGPPVHDPPLEWPDTEDRIEAFIGVEGTPTNITLPDGIYGFDEVWTKDKDNIRTGAGVMILSGTPYKNDGTSPLNIDLTDVFQGDTLVPGSWHYIYLKQGPAPGFSPIPKISVTGPNQEGRHPTDNGALFLSSVYLDSSSEFPAFSKTGSRVRKGLNSGPDLFSAFAVPDGLFQNTDLSALLPDTLIGSVKLWLLCDLTGTPGNGDRVYIDVKQTGRSFAGLSHWPLKPANSTRVVQVIDVILDGNKTFDIRFETGNFQSVIGAFLLEYSEGRFTSGSALGA